MKKLFLMAAFVAGPILYAQQKPLSAKDLQKEDVIKTEQRKTSQAKPATQVTRDAQTTQGARAIEAKVLNPDRAKARRAKMNAHNNDPQTTRKDAKASSFKSTIAD